MNNERIYASQSEDDMKKIEIANRRAYMERKENAIQSLNKAIEEALKDMTSEEISEHVQGVLASRKREI